MNRFGMTIATAVLFGLFAVAEEKPDVKFTFTDLQNKQDAVTTERVDGKTLLRLKSPRGIGSCTVTAEKGTWPDEVAVLFADFAELEHFEMSLGRMYIHGSRKTSGQFDLFYLDNDRNHNKRSRIGSIDAKVERRKDGILLVLPRLFFADADKVTLHWISWLR